MDSTTARKDLEGIFMAGVRRVDPYLLVHHSMRVQSGKLVVDSGDTAHSFDLGEFNRIFVIGFGKATAKMANAVEEILGGRITEGVISVKYGHTVPLNRIQPMEAGHPVPDENGIQAAQTIAELASRADERTLVVALISGGGSALIPCPLDLSDQPNGVSLSLAEKQEVTQILLDCGATIHELNTVRKHLSGIKGGRLAAMVYPATSLNLMLSDVVGDDLDVIASGPTTPDSSTFQMVRAIFDRYSVYEQIPRNIIEILKLGLAKEIPETPKPGDKRFDRVHNILIGTNALALSGCKIEAEKRGYEVHILTSKLTGEARDVASDLYATAGKYRFAVGIPITRYPPHRSQRAELPHWAPTLSPDVQTQIRVAVINSCFRQPFGYQPNHALPGKSASLASSFQRTIP